MIRKPNKTLKIIGGIFGFLAAVGLWVWYDLETQPANDGIRVGVQQMLFKEPRMRPAYDEAMSDGKLTTMEAWRLIRQADALKK
jgi:hypothetical protein